MSEEISIYDVTMILEKLIAQGFVEEFHDGDEVKYRLTKEGIEHVETKL